MTITSNLGLSVYDTASGSATTFQAFRLAVAGVSSNMTKIDSFVGDTSSSIVNLKANSVVNVSANLTSSNFYTGNSSFMSVYMTNMIINLKLNTTIGGATTININSLGNVILKKININGTLVDLVSGDLVANKYYWFIYNGTYFVLFSIAGSEVLATVSGSVSNLVAIGGISGCLVDSGISSTSLSINKIWSAMAKPTSESPKDDEFDNTSGSTLNAKWSVFDNGSFIDSIKIEGYGLEMLPSIANTGGVAGIYQPVPAGDFTAWTKSTQISTQEDSIYSGIFLAEDIVNNPTTAPLVTMAVCTGGFAYAINVDNWENYNTYGQNIRSGIYDLPFMGTYTRVRVNSTTFSLDTSMDGETWITKMMDEALPFTPLYVGLFVRNSNNTNQPMGIFPFCRFTSGANHNQVMRGNKV